MFIKSPVRLVEAGALDSLRKDGLFKTTAYIAAALLVFLLFRFLERYLSVMNQLLIGWTALVTLVICSRFALFKRPPWRILLIAAAGFISLRYFIWRTFETLIYTGFYDLVGLTLLYTAEAYTMVIHFLGMFINVWPLDRGAAPLPEDASEYPCVDVFIPTYTESLDIVRITATAALQIDYPKEKFKVHILDDGSTVSRRNDPGTGPEAWERFYDLRRMAKELGANYITRERNVSAKAGNINHALEVTDAELVLILDCDHVPTMDILKNTAGWFLKDKKLFCVQTPHFFINPTPVEKNLAAFKNVSGENDMFYKIIHPGLDAWNASYFCGSAALLRRSALEEVGGISGFTITEDAETSFLLHGKGYNSVYINKPMVCALSPETFDDYIIQRTRWAQGMIQLFMLNNPLRARGLKISQRLCYFNACFFWFFGISRFIFYLAPASFLILGLKVYHASLMQILAYALPHVIATFILMDFLYGKARRPFFSEIYESVQSLFLMPAVISAVLHPRRPTFKITPKGRKLEKNYLNPLASTFFVVAMVNIAAMPIAVAKWFNYPMYRDVIILTGSWCLFNIFLAFVSLGAFWENKQLRTYHRIRARGPVEVFFNRLNKSYMGEMEDVSLTGIGILLKVPFQLKPEEEVALTVKDSYGEQYVFQARIMRSIKRPRTMFCGTKFVLDGASYSRAVRFVYGDSARWADIWDEKEGHAPAARLLLRFLHMGVVASKDCFMTLNHLSFGLIKGYAYALYSAAAGSKKPVARWLGLSRADA